MPYESYEFSSSFVLIKELTLVKSLNRLVVAQYSFLKMKKSRKKREKKREEERRKGSHI